MCRQKWLTILFVEAAGLGLAAQRSLLRSVHMALMALPRTSVQVRATHLPTVLGRGGLGGRPGEGFAGGSSAQRLVPVANASFLVATIRVSGQLITRLFGAEGTPLVSGKRCSGKKSCGRNTFRKMAKGSRLRPKENRRFRLRRHTKKDAF